MSFSSAASFGQNFRFECEGCGHFKISSTDLITIQGSEWSDDQRLRVAHWVWKETRLGAVQVIDHATMEGVTRLDPPSTRNRLDNFLQIAVELTNNAIGGEFRLDDSKLRVGSFCRDTQECFQIGRYWVGRGAFHQVHPGRPGASVTAEGHLAYDELQRKRGSTTQGFVAMWFHDSTKSAYVDGIAPAIRAAGYEPLRIDQVPHDCKIDDRIIAEIRRSRFVVADFTGHRGGVYYEAGFAHGLGLSVIFTCHKDGLNDLHFDVRQYNTIVWEQPDELRVLLHNRLLALFSAGALAPDAAPI